MSDQPDQQEPDPGPPTEETSEASVDKDPGPQEGPVAPPGEGRTFCGRRIRGGWPPQDRAGKVIPHRMNSIMMLRSLPWLMPAFKTVVPDEFWSRDLDGERQPMAVVACPCGEEPKVSLAKLSECRCGRFFLYLGDELRCFNAAEDAQVQGES